MAGSNGVASTMMSDHEKHTEFLRQCILYDESTRRQELHERITRIQRDARCVRRAVWLMAMLIALVVAGLGYEVILVDNFPYNLPQLIINLVCALGMGSLISLLAFMGLGMVYRSKAGPAAGGMPSTGREAVGVPPGQTGHHALARQSCR